VRALLLEGPPRERGRRHGEALRGEIGEAVTRWSGLVEGRGRNAGRRIAALTTRSPYLATLDRRCPELLDEVRGIAEGAGQPFELVLALNLMDEEWWFEDDEETGCSLVAGRSDAHSPPILAQNMDLPAWMDGLQTVLRIREEGEGAASERVVLSAAGMIGLAGMRMGGVAVGVNTLLQLPRSVHGIPVAFIVRAVLEQRDAEAAAGFLAAVPHASGQHYAVADGDRVFGVECSATGAVLRRFARNEWLLHTNHPLWSDPAQVLAPEEVGIVGVRLHSSHRRLDALETFATFDGTVEGMRTTLADRESGVCMVASPEYPTSTFGSVEFCPGRGIARVLPGSQAGDAEWIEVRARESERVA
jgi:hypothetical protein